MKQGQKKVFIAQKKEDDTPARLKELDGLFYINHHVCELQEAFPYNNNLWTVDRYYPALKLYIDTPRFPFEFEDSATKRGVMEKLGLKYEVLP